MKHIVKALPNNTMKIMPNTPETYRKLIQHVRDEKKIHNTYKIKRERAYRIVIRDLHHSIPISDIIEELDKKEHKVRNTINVKHRISKEPLPLFFVDLEPQSNIKEMLNHPDVKILSYNVKDARIMAAKNILYKTV
jgi:hypothetical protein